MPSRRRIFTGLGLTCDGEISVMNYALEELVTSLEVTCDGGKVEGASSRP